MKTFDKILAVAIIIVFVLAGLAVTQAVRASDENGERFCMAQNIYLNQAINPSQVN